MLGKFIKPEAVILNLQSTEKDEVFEELNETLVSLFPSLDRVQVLNSLLEREKKMSTGIIPGIAIPHAISDRIKEPLVAVGISRPGIDFDSLDGKPVHLIFMVLFPADDTSLHLSIMQRFALLFGKNDFYKTIMEKTTSEQVVQAICGCEENL
ncbi:MAG: PTS sugar transporter subunit IIA [Treponema sp.]|uniref:PTS sugar transporter subunit IIA n=1 Tax=Treponema sp. TaxID=166 RepID=UPI001B79EBCB|nr:PTS sugar transporter subunit IIA [Treponema sp.]MBP5401736.1 PTS sugar transporter subunit IIA [Treponema sp.]MBR5932539.1 PTS sugar transporter subunit IIA [Treponema sp.]